MMENWSQDEEVDSPHRKWYEGGSIRMLEEKTEVIAGWQEMKNPEYWERIRQQKQVQGIEEGNGVVMVTDNAENPPNNEKMSVASVASTGSISRGSETDVDELIVQVGTLGNQVGMLTSQVGTFGEQFGTVGKNVEMLSSQVGTFAGQFGTLEGQLIGMTNQIDGCVTELKAMAHQYGSLVAQNNILARRVANLETAMQPTPLNQGSASPNSLMLPLDDKPLIKENDRNGAINCGDVDKGLSLENTKGNQTHQQTRKTKVSTCGTSNMKHGSVSTRFLRMKNNHLGTRQEKRSKNGKLDGPKGASSKGAKKEKGPLCRRQTSLRACVGGTVYV